MAFALRLPPHLMSRAAIVLFSGVNGFQLAFFNSGLSGYSAFGHLGGIVKKMRERPDIEREFPSLFNMLLMESYVEHRMKTALQPLQTERDKMMGRVASELKDSEWTSQHTDQLATVAAVDVMMKLTNYAPAKAVKLLQMEVNGTEKNWRVPMAPRAAFKPMSKAMDAIHDRLGIELALRDRFDYKGVINAVQSQQNNMLARAGVDLENRAQPSGDVASDKRFLEMSPEIKASANQLTQKLFAGGVISDMPIVSRTIMPDIDDIPEAQRSQVMQDRLTNTIARLAVSIQNDQFVEKEREGSNGAGVLRRRKERAARREERAIA